MDILFIKILVILDLSVVSSLVERLVRRVLHILFWEYTRSQIPDHHLCESIRA